MLVKLVGLVLPLWPLLILPPPPALQLVPLTLVAVVETLARLPLLYRVNAVVLVVALVEPVAVLLIELRQLPLPPRPLLILVGFAVGAAWLDEVGTSRLAPLRLAQ